MSDESLRRAGRAELDRLNADGNPSGARAAPPKAKRKQVKTGYADLLGIGKAKERRSGPEGDTVMDAVDKAVKGAKPDSY